MTPTTLLEAARYFTSFLDEYPAADRRAGQEREHDPK